MTMGIAPITGIPLPFVSVGGSSMISNLAGVGVLLAIHARERAEARVKNKALTMAVMRAVQEAKRGSAEHRVIARRRRARARAVARERRSARAATRLR